MPPKSQPNKYQNTTNISNVIKNKTERCKATHVINSEGKCFVLYNGNRLTEKQFSLILPIEIKIESTKGDLIGKSYL